MRTRGLALACVALSAVSCGSQAGPGTPDADSTPISTDRMYAVAADEDATAADIVAAGGVDEVEASGSGSLLVSYLVESDDDEGPQAAAWRLYSPSGEQVAEGLGTRISEASASPQLWSLPDAVLLAPELDSLRGLVRIADDGSVTEVPASEVTSPAQAGDVLLTSTTVYRPADDSTYVLPKLPHARQLTDVALDASGGLWLLPFSSGPTATVLHCAAGAPPCVASEVPPAAAPPSSIELVGDRIYLPAVEQGMDGADLGGLWVRDLADPDTTPWREVGRSGIDPTRWYVPTLSALDDGTLVIGDSGDEWFAGGEDDWHRLALPDGTDPDFTSLHAIGDLLYATGRAPEDGYVSDDLGETWQRLPR